MVRRAVEDSRESTFGIRCSSIMNPYITLQCADMFPKRKQKRSSSHIKYALHALAKTPDLICIGIMSTA